MAKKTTAKITNVISKSEVQQITKLAPKSPRLEGCIDMYKSVKSVHKIANWFTKTDSVQRKAIWDRIEQPSITISEFLNFGKSVYGSINIPNVMLANAITLCKKLNVEIKAEWIYDPNKSSKSADKEKRAIAKSIQQLADMKANYTAQKSLLKLAETNQAIASQKLIMSNAKIVCEHYESLKASIPKSELPKVVKGTIQRLTPSGFILAQNAIMMKQLGQQFDISAEIKRNKYVKSISETYFKDYFLKNPTSAIKTFLPDLDNTKQVIDYVKLVRRQKLASQQQKTA